MRTSRGTCSISSARSLASTTRPVADWTRIPSGTGGEQPLDVGDPRLDLAAGIRGLDEPRHRGGEICRGEPASREHLLGPETAHLAGKDRVRVLDEREHDARGEGHPDVVEDGEATERRDADDDEVELSAVADP